MDDASTNGKNESDLSAGAPLEQFIHDASPEALAEIAADPRLNEDLALALLQRRDLLPETLEQLHKHRGLGPSRKVQVALVTHPRTPRHVSIPAIRQLFTFELMKVALLPGVLPDVKRAAEETLLAKLGTTTSGECYSLAKQGSGRIAAALLLSNEERTVQAALANPQMTEAWIVKALRAGTGTERLARIVSYHQKWSPRIEVRIALVANPYTPFARMAQIAHELQLKSLRDVLRDVRLTPNVKAHLKLELQKRTSGT